MPATTRGPASHLGLARRWVLVGVCVAGCGGRSAEVFDGHWSGETSQGTPIEFSVDEGGLRDITVWILPAGGQCSRVRISTVVPPGYSVADGDVKVGTSDMEFEGHFESPGKASGRFFYKRPPFGADDCDGRVEITWQARNVALEPGSDGGGLP